MRLLSTSVVALAFLVVGFSQLCSAQVVDTPHWKIECVKGVSRGKKIPCDDLNASANTFNFYKTMSINTDAKTASGSLTFEKKPGNWRRGLKIIEVTPARVESNASQEYWFTAHSGVSESGGRGGRGVVTLMFTGYNINNRGNANHGYASPGEYNGTLKLQDTLSGEVFTINLSVQVTKIEKK